MYKNFFSNWFSSRSSDEKLIQNTSAYSILFDKSPLPQAIVTLQGIVLDANTAYYTLHQLTDNVIGQSLITIGITSAAEWDSTIQAYGANGNKLDGHLTANCCVNRQTIYVKLFSHPITFNGTDAVMIVLHDITQQRQVEIALKESERFLQMLIDNIPTCVFWKNTDSVIMGVNKAILNDNGLSDSDKLIGKTDYDFVDKDLADKIRMDDASVMQEDRRKIFQEERIKQADGSTQWRLTSKVPLKDVAGNVIGLLGTYDDITERKKEESALNLIRFSVAKATSCIVWLRRDGQVVDCNPAFCEMLQYTREELLTLSIPKLDPNYNQENWDAHWTDLSEQKSLKFFSKQWRKDGTLRDIEVRAHYLEFEGEEYNVGFIHDITERLQEEERLTLASQFQQTLLNNIPAGVFWKDRELRYLGVNAMFRKVSNYDEDVVGKTDYDFPWVEQAEALRADDKYVMDNNAPKLYYVEPLRNADGKIHYNEVSKVPLVDTNGNVFGVMGAFRDITDQMEAQNALRASEQLFKGVVQNAPAIIYILDMNGIFLLSEGLGLELLGLKPGEVVGQSAFDLYKDFPALTDIIREALTGRKITEEIVVGRFTFNSRFTPMRNHDGELTSVLGVSFDISERKKLEDALNKLNTELEVRVSSRTEQLQQANQDLEAFAYSVSHDLRAPIRHIDGFSKLMYRAIPQPSDTVTKHFHRITQSSGRMAQMVDDLLTFARLGKKAITQKVVNIDVIVSTVIEELKIELLNRHIEWRIHTLGNLMGDANLLQLAFENLIRNAIKYTALKPEATIEIGSSRTPTEVEFYIRDNGVGFDMAYGDKLFGVFQRLHGHEEFEGTGIGLANVRQIITKHSGSVRAEGKVGEGAIFYLTFPLT